MKEVYRGASAPEATRMPLDQIESRILDQTQSIADITGRLNEHANLVHGYPPAEKSDENLARDLPDARLERISIALDGLSIQISHLAHAAGRNTNLA